MPSKQTKKVTKIVKQAPFKKGSRVKFAVTNMHGTAKGKGVITALVPKGAVKGAARLTVKGDDGKVRKLFVNSCTVLA